MNSITFSLRLQIEMAETFQGQNGVSWPQKAEQHMQS